MCLDNNGKDLEDIIFIDDKLNRIDFPIREQHQQ